MLHKQRRSKPGLRIQRINLVRLWCLYSSTAVATKPSSMVKAIFDTDSSLLRIDNCATRSNSPDTGNFVSELRPVLNTRVQGVRGKVGNVMTGTIRWQIEDNQGRVHTLHLLNSLYLPKFPKKGQTGSPSSKIGGLLCADVHGMLLRQSDAATVADQDSE